MQYLISNRSARAFPTGVQPPLKYRIIFLLVHVESKYARAINRPRKLIGHCLWLAVLHLPLYKTNYRAHRCGCECLLSYANQAEHYNWLKGITDSRSELETGFLDFLFKNGYRSPDAAQNRPMSSQSLLIFSLMSFRVSACPFNNQPHCALLTARSFLRSLLSFPFYIPSPNPEPDASNRIDRIRKDGYTQIFEGYGAQRLPISRSDIGMVILWGNEAI